MSDRPDECLCDVPPFRGHRSGGRAVKASELADRLAGLGTTWDTCKRLDAHSNTHPRPPRPEVGSRVVLADGDEGTVVHADRALNRALVLCDGEPRRVPLDELEVVR